MRQPGQRAPNPESFRPSERQPVMARPKDLAVDRLGVYSRFAQTVPPGNTVFTASVMCSRAVAASVGSNELIAIT